MASCLRKAKQKGQFQWTKMGRAFMARVDVNNFKLWPHLTIVALICAIVAGVAVGLWVRYEQKASAEALPNAARIQRVDGDVALNNSGADMNSSDVNWVAASANQPFSVGDRIYTRDNSHASVAFTGRNFARLNPNTSLDALSLADRRTQLALRDGSAMFDVGYLAPGELFEVATPYGAVDLQQPGLYNVGIDNGSVLVSVLSGLAQVVGLSGSGQIGKGEVLRLLGQTAADVVLSRVDGRQAGYLIDDYYGYQYPQYYDGRYRDYNVYLNDPYYFDPYRRTNSYRYVNSYIPGLYDLDYYGNWQNLNGYGYAWSPRVDSYWAPYQQGYWMTDYPYGPTWVSSEPWGYAPYHYGRWANVNNQWYWIPDSVNSTPLYSPALVAFVPLAQNEIGWVPLGPGDAYAPRYYNNDWSPYYLTRTQNIQPRVVNLYVPGAVTVVPIDDFTRGVDLGRARRADRQILANVNPVLDPLTLTPLRNAVIHSAWGRGKKDIPPGIAKKLDDTRVVTTTSPIAVPFNRDLARAMRVEPVSNRMKNEKFKVRDERQNNEPNKQSFSEVSRPNENQERGAQQRELKQQPQTAEPQIDRATRKVQAERNARPVRPQVEGERVGNRAQQQVQREAVRPEQPRAEKAPGRMREKKPPVQMEQPRAQPQAAPVRQKPQMNGQPRVERAPASSVGNQRKEQRHGPPQAPAQQEQKQGPPAGNPQSNAGGKGKKKP
jgi:Family of unknown function (DUF6600)/FecR protein